MGRLQRVVAASLAALALPAGPGPLRAAEPAPDPSAVERGRVALTSHGYLKPSWGGHAYKNVGKLWGPGAPDPDRDPEAYAAAFRRRYGLNPAPYPNDGLPMGLRRGVMPDGSKKGIQIDCMLCHGGSIGGQAIVGLGNTELDLTRLFQEMTRADGAWFPLVPYVINSARGTVNAGMFSAVLLSLRNSDLSFRRFPLPLGAHMPEMDTPAWWLLARKESMYYDGRTPAANVRTNMQFLLGEKTLDQFKALEPTFRDIQSYILSLRPPAYPFPVDRAKAERGRAVFEANCTKCHGTYGPQRHYPNVVVPLNEIGTDPGRVAGMSDKMVAHYNSTWFAEEHPSDPEMTGYQAPPLDGVWATAPYLHNGSVPTLYHLLKSSSRPARFLRPPSTEFEHYDRERVGWTSRRVESPESLSPEERHSLVDTSRFGLSNGGHTFGDKLSETDRMDLIEYLKTL
jgi:hypothetical protein